MSRGSQEEQEPATRDQREAGRLLARPGAVNEEEAPSGLRALNLGAERDGLLYVPSGYDVTNRRLLP